MSKEMCLDLGFGVRLLFWWQNICFGTIELFVGLWLPAELRTILFGLLWKWSMAIFCINLLWSTSSSIRTTYHIECSSYQVILTVYFLLSLHLYQNKYKFIMFLLGCNVLMLWFYTLRLDSGGKTVVNRFIGSCRLS